MSNATPSTLTTSLFSSTASTWIANERNSTSSHLDHQSAFVRIIWYRFLLVIIILVTAIGNILVCLAIARERKLQNTTNYFLMSLAIADCLVAVLVMPMAMVAEVLGHFPLPHNACVIFATMDVLCCTSSIWHMSTMSMDRYFTIRFPFRYGRNKTRRIMLLKIIAVWAISTCISSPVFVLGLVDQQNVLSNGICAPNNASFKIYGSIFAFYIPFVIMITTYALTMRSLRNVLVNKKRYSRERRRKQTFRPLAQIIHQYAEIAQGIRRSSASKKGSIPTAATAPPNTSSNNNDTTNNCHTHTNGSASKAPFTMITNTSPTDGRTQFFPTNTTHVNTHQENNSLGLINGTNMNSDSTHHHSQHLTISYIKPSSNKKRRQQQQQLVSINAGNNRTMNECDMSTVYEITEYSKSTSSAHEFTVILSSNGARRSIVINEQQQLTPKLVDKIEHSPTRKETTTTITTTAMINEITPVEEEEPSSASDVPDSVDIPISSSPSPTPTTPMISFLPWTNSIDVVQWIVHYYLFYFPYRSRPLSVDYPSSLRPNPTSDHRSVSTQTTLLSPVDLPNPQSSHLSDLYSSDASKRRRFHFHRSALPSSSLLTNLFRHSSSATPLRSSESSTKSSVSWGQRSSVASSSHRMRQRCPSTHHSSGCFHRIESEMDNLLATERRSHASTSSSSLLQATCRHGNYPVASWQKPLRRHPYQSRSAYVIGHSHRCRPHQHRHALSSTTNTNSSDSSSMIVHRSQPRLLPNPLTHQHRMRDEDLVAANERKALRVLLIIFCVFITLWTPFFICTFISAICERCRERISATVWFSITWLGYSSSMANPFIYTIFSDVFRRAFSNIIFCRANDSSFTGQFSTKLSYPRGVLHPHVHQPSSRRRSPNHDQSGTSTPVPLLRPTLIGGSDGAIHLHRAVSDSFR